MGTPKTTEINYSFFRPNPPYRRAPGCHANSFIGNDPPLIVGVGRRLRRHVTRLGPEAVAKVKGVFRFDITEKKKVVKTWTADLKNGDGSLVEGEGTKPDVTIT